jgi:hypothetical protein
MREIIQIVHQAADFIETLVPRPSDHGFRVRVLARNAGVKGRSLCRNWGVWSRRPRSVPSALTAPQP